MQTEELVTTWHGSWWRTIPQPDVSHLLKPDLPSAPPAYRRSRLRDGEAIDRVYAALDGPSLTASEIQRRTNLRMAQIDQALWRLQQKGRIERDGPRIPRKTKYRRTPGAA